jgi:hypothetical protein
MAQYLLSVHYVDGDPATPRDQMEQTYEQVAALNQELMDGGQWVFGGGLHEPHVATVVRSEGGKVVTTDGPFAEGKEHIGGFWILDLPDLDAALAMAARASAACGGPVEVRPFQDGPPEA